MGYLILVGAAVTRAPQVLKVWNRKACEGLNPLSHEIEMFGYIACVLNGLRLKLPVDMWGENLFHSTFGTAMVLMIYAFAKPDSREAVSKKRKVAVLAAVAALCATGVTGLLPSSVVYRLYDVQSTPAAGCLCGAVFSSRSDCKRLSTCRHCVFREPSFPNSHQHPARRHWPASGHHACCPLPRQPNADKHDDHEGRRLPDADRPR